MVGLWQAVWLSYTKNTFEGLFICFSKVIQGVGAKNGRAHLLKEVLSV
jgi:hypothetical protein